MSISPNDPKLTAFALGELDDKVQRFEVEKAVNFGSLDLLRKEKRMNFKAEVELEAQPASQPAVSRILEQKEQVGEILRLLETLPSNQQEVIRLRFQNDFSYREISAVTDLSVSNVGFLIHTGLKTIRRKLKALSRSRHTFMRRVK